MKQFTTWLYCNTGLGFIHSCLQVLLRLRLPSTRSGVPNVVTAAAPPAAPTVTTKEHP